MDSPNHYVVDKNVQDLAKAIAFAEGFGVPGAVPTRAHNPGDLKLTGYPTTGEEGIAVFPDDDTGWYHLYKQLDFIRFGQSHVYTTKMTLREFAERWTDTEQGPWLNNVIEHLIQNGYCVDAATTLSQVFIAE